METCEGSHLLSSIKTVSIVLSRVQLARQGSLVGSTYFLVSLAPHTHVADNLKLLAGLGMYWRQLTVPFLGFTQGRLTSVMNWMSGGLSGY
jgi:hypothetical protein